MHTGKWPERGCVDALRTLSKIRKLASSKLDEIKKEEAEYLESDAYKKKVEENEKKVEADEDDEVRNDKDPDGWKAYVQAAEG